VISAYRPPKQNLNYLFLIISYLIWLISINLSVV